MKIETPLGSIGAEPSAVTPNLSVLNALTLRQLDKKRGKVGRLQRISSYLSTGLGSRRVVNPIAANQADILPWVLYDRLAVGIASAWPVNQKFFTVPIGSAGKTKEDTNVEQVSRLPDPQWFNTQGIGFYFESNMDKADVDLIMQNTYIEFWIAQKIYAEGKLAYYPSAAGLSGYTTKTNEGWYNIGAPLPQAYFDLRLPQGMLLGQDQGGQALVTDGITGQTILQGQNFKIEVYSTTFTTTAAVRFYAFLFGILSRGVQ